jgi:hypothetical protein
MASTLTATSQYDDKLRLSKAQKDFLMNKAKLSENDLRDLAG